MNYVECEVSDFDEDLTEAELKVLEEKVDSLLAHAPAKMDCACQCQQEPTDTPTTDDREFQFRVAKFLYNARPDMRWSLTNKMIHWLDLEY